MFVGEKRGTGPQSFSVRLKVAASIFSRLIHATGAIHHNCNCCPLLRIFIKTLILQCLLRTHNYSRPSLACFSRERFLTRAWSVLKMCGGGNGGGGWDNATVSEQRSDSFIQLFVITVGQLESYFQGRLFGTE